MVMQMYMNMLCVIKCTVEGQNINNKFAHAHHVRICTAIVLFVVKPMMHFSS